jgi:two-component system cell cycle sensor histidine kinase/response regulator CckA
MEGATTTGGADMFRSSLFSLRNRILALIFFVLLPSLVLVIYTTSHERNREIAESRENVFHLARLASLEEQRLIEETRELLVVISGYRSIREHDAKNANRDLASLLSGFPRYTNFGVAGPDGLMWASALPMPRPVDISDRDYFQRAVLNKGLGIGGFQIGRVTGVPGINLGYPIFNDAGEIKNVVFAAMSPAAMNRFEVEMAAWLPTGSSLTRMDDEGRVLSRWPGGAADAGRPAPEFSLLMNARARGDDYTRFTDSHGRDFLNVFARVPTSLSAGDVFVVLSIPENEVFSEARSVLRRGLLGLGLVALVSLGAGWIGTNVVVLRPVRKLLGATKRLAGGDLSARTGQEHGRGELGELAAAFDGMAETLQERQYERDRAEEALRRSEADYRSLVQNAPYGIMRSTPDGRVLRANPALVKMLGYDTEEDVLKLILPRDVYVDSPEGGRTLETTTEADPRDLALRFRRRDGKEIQVRASGRWVREDGGRLQYLESILEDVTERKSLEAQLAQAQKMEAVGRLAGGVAHDFNNLLGVMLGYSELLLGELDANDPRRQRAAEIKRASDRAASLTRQLLAFSRRQVLTPRVVDLNAVVDSLDKMLRRLIGEDVNLVSRLGVDVGRVRIDPNQIDQVLMNLVVNARDAMPEGGKIILETANLDLSTPQIYENVTIPAGSYVRLAVTDTGIGMDEETRVHIFEPFFTTKEVGKGTGLGLSMVYGIVRQSGGHIVSRSRPGKGTTFEIYLPRVDESEQMEAVRAAADLPRGTETILLVEDEDALRDLLREFLASGGYTVLDASNGSVAVQIARNFPRPIHLVVTDVSMPGIQGRQVADEVLRIRPEVRVLYISGYTDDSVLRDGAMAEGTAFLGKPFTQASLLGRVREELDRARAGTRASESGGDGADGGGRSEG